MSDLSGDYGRQMEEGCRAALDKMNKTHLALLGVSKDLLEIQRHVKEATRLFGETYGTTDAQQILMLKGQPGADTLIYLTEAQGALKWAIHEVLPLILSHNDEAGRRALMYLQHLRRISGLE